MFDCDRAHVSGDPSPTAPLASTTFATVSLSHTCSDQCTRLDGMSVSSCLSLPSAGLKSSRWREWRLTAQRWHRRLTRDDSDTGGERSGGTIVDIGTAALTRIHLSAATASIDWQVDSSSTGPTTEAGLTKLNLHAQVRG